MCALAPDGEGQPCGRERISMPLYPGAQAREIAAESVGSMRLIVIETVVVTCGSRVSVYRQDDRRHGLHLGVRYRDAPKMDSVPRL